jgi:hypothetical protein
MLTWLDIQNGVLNPPDAMENPSFQHVFSPRILGAKVHNDPLFQFYYNAALICFQNGINAQGIQIPNSSSWTTGGNPSVLASVAHVCEGALKVAWRVKWGLIGRIRPEVLGQRIHKALTDENLRVCVPGYSDIYAMYTDEDFPGFTNILDKINNHNNDPNNPEEKN